MPTSAVGSDGLSANSQRGFTLLELLVVLAILGAASAGVVFSLRPSADAKLEQAAQKVAAQLEVARGISRATGIRVQVRPSPRDPSAFVVLPSDMGIAVFPLPEGVRVQWPASDSARQAFDAEPGLVLGPEPLIAGQSLVIAAGASLWQIKTNGLAPFEAARL